MAAPIPTPGVSPASFAAGVLRGLGAPLTPQNIAGIVGWAKAEGGHYNGARFNFLNTTEPMPGAGNTGTQGNIKVYNSPQQGVAATVATLRNGHYAGILQALHNSDPHALASAIGASPWGTSGSLVSQTIGDALGQHFNVPTPVPGQGTPTPTQRAARVSQTTSTPDWADAGVAAFLKAANKPIDMSGKIHPDNTLNNMISMANANPIVSKVTTPISQRLAVSSSAIATAQSAGANADSQKLLRMLHDVQGAPYSQANHDAINQGAGSVRARGTDCSGLISWLMGPQGLNLWHSSQTTPTIPASGLQHGPGHTITVWDNPQPGNAGHVFIQIGNQYFAAEGGVGVHQLPGSEVHQYLTQGSDGGHYVAYHPAGG